MMIVECTCECGVLTGKPCAWRGPASATVRLRAVPWLMRHGYVAAGYTSIAQVERDAGLPRHSRRVPGAVLVLVSRGCAELLVVAGDEWHRVVE